MTVIPTKPHNLRSSHGTIERMADGGVDNWFNVLSALGIISGLFFTATSARSESKTRQVANLLTITSNHREIWKDFYTRSDLARVLDPSANVLKQPITAAEEEWVKSAIFHVATVFYARTDSLLLRMQGLRMDVKGLLSFPIPAAIWEKIKPFQNADFVRFVEECRLMERRR